MASRKRRWVGWTTAAIVVVVALAIGGYAFAWFHYARQIETVARTNLAAVATGGRQAECPQLASSGFPLSMRLSCSGFVYSDPGAHVAVETGPIASAAHVYDPMTLTGSVVAPARVALPDTPALRFTWQTLIADTHLAEPLPSHVALSGTDIAASLEDGGKRLLHMASLALKARPHGRDLNVTLDFGGLAVSQVLTPDIDLPPLDGAFQVDLKQGVPMLIRPPKTLRGVSVRIGKAALSSGEAGIEVSGPVSIDKDGVMDARLQLSIRRPEEIAQLLGDALPRRRQEIGQALGALSMLGDETKLPLRIERGKAYIGFIKVGNVPRL